MISQRFDGNTVWLTEHDCDIEAFKRHIDRATHADDYPTAAEIMDKIPIYDGADLRRRMDDERNARSAMAEWHRAFLTGPGIIAIRGGYADTALLDAVSEQLFAIVEEEKAIAGKGDHFASAGANSRIWNAHEKLCVKAPELYVRYNANELTRRVAESWLGSGYQITFQANVVHPGGKAQTVHRDYHMGFQDVETLKGFPASQHALSASLTLQGAVAHSDMPLESGPTKLLPYSQSYEPGYLAVLLPEFRQVFEESFVQLPLSKGDLLFFNPATFHAAGENTTTHIDRFANLMQIGSTFGRSIEIVDRSRISIAAYKDLVTLLDRGSISQREADNVIAATAEGYPFPANLDIESPLSGMAPPSQQDLLRLALREGWSLPRLREAIDDRNRLKRSN